MFDEKNTANATQTPETLKEALRSESRDRARRRALKDHGATGEPPKMDPVEAFNTGTCYGCSGHYPGALHKHIPGCLCIEPPVKHWIEFRDRIVPANRRGLVQLRTPAMRAKFSAGAKRGYDENTPEGRAHRENLATAKRGTTRILYWPTIKLITSGHSAVKAAELFTERTKTVQERKEKQGGLAFGTDFACDFGHPVRCEQIIASRKAANFKADEFDKLLGFSTKRPPNSIVGPADALRWIAWRNELVARLLAQPENKSYRKDEVLKSFVPQIPIANDSLLKTVPAMRDAVRKSSSWTVDELCEFVLTEARREKTEEWYSTVRFLWQIEPWLLAGGLARLGSDDVDGPIVREIIGSVFHWEEGGKTFYPKQQWVQAAMRDRTGTITPDDMERWIFRYASEDKGGRQQSEQRRGKKRSRPKAKRGKGKKTDDLLHLCAAFEKIAQVENVEPNVYAMAPVLYPLGPTRDQDGAEAATRLLRKRHRKELDHLVLSMTESEARQRIAAATQVRAAYP